MKSLTSSNSLNPKQRNKKKRYIKPEEVRELERLSFKQNQKKYPNIPLHAIVKPKYRDDNTNELTKCVLQYCKLNDIHAERIANTGRNLNGKWITGTGTNGTADIHAIYKGKALMIEIKCRATKDRQSQEQKKYQKMVEKAGGIYIIVRDFPHFLQEFKSKFSGNE